MIKVSCIVPIYNLFDKVDTCIESLINQTLIDIEIILVNDCSTDNTIEVLEKYRNSYKNIILLDLKENMKQGGARNMGVKVAKGKYIIFIDGDDYVDSDMLSTLYTHAVEKDLDIVDSDYFQQDEQGNTKYTVSIPNDFLNDKRKLIMNTGRIWTKLIKRELIIENEIYFLENKKFEDNPYLPILFAYTDKIGKINKAFYHYIYNNQSSSRKRDDFSMFDRLDTSLYLLNEVKKRKIYNKFAEEYDYVFINIYFVITIITCMTKFNVIPYNYINKAYYGLREYVPNYRSNPYIKESPKYMKILIRLNLLELYCFITIVLILQKIGLDKYIIGKAKQS